MTLAALVLGLVLAPQEPKPLSERSFSDLMTDDRDGNFDVSEYLLTRGAFLPVPIIISEPAVGYGGGLAAIFFHEPPIGDPEKAATDPDQKRVQILPKSVSFAAGGGTENGTWFAGGGHFEAWDEGAWRFLAAALYASVNLKYYGLGGEFDLQKDPLKYNIRPALGVLQLQRQVTGPFFVGLRYLFVNAEVDFDRDPLPAGTGLPDPDFSLRSAGVGVLLTYDTRDNLMTPSEGVQIELRPQFFDESLGGDVQFARLDAVALGYLPLDPFTLGGRIYASFVTGDAPFYQLPYIEMRGVPAMRYLGEHVVTVEAEIALDLTPRWSVLAFGGVGRAEVPLDNFDTASNVYAGGLGFRYLIARRFGLKVGVDAAISNDDHAVYLQIGSGWH